MIFIWLRTIRNITVMTVLMTYFIHRNKQANTCDKDAISLNHVLKSIHVPPIKLIN